MTKAVTNQGRRNSQETFWCKVDVRGPSECWPWLLACAKSGYGWHSENGTTINAHRYAYFVTYGIKSTRGKPVMHTCNNKSCCNPFHLKLGTASRNVADAYKDGLAQAGSRHYNAKIPSSVVADIRNSKSTCAALARLYGISKGHVARIKNGSARKHEAVNG